MAQRKSRAQALHQRRARHDPDRPPARLLPQMAESARGHAQGPALYPGGFAARDRRRPRGLVPLIVRLAKPLSAERAKESATYAQRAERAIRNNKDALRVDVTSLLANECDCSVHPIVNASIPPVPLRVDAKNRS